MAFKMNEPPFKLRKDILKMKEGEVNYGNVFANSFTMEKSPLTQIDPESGRPWASGKSQPYHKKFNPRGIKGKVTDITKDVIHKEINRLARGGTPKAKQILTRDIAKKAAKKSAKKSLLSRIAGKLGGKLLGAAGFYAGSMQAATATQPGTGVHGGKRQTTYNPVTNRYE